jgi:hypothetical protein
MDAPAMAGGRRARGVTAEPLCWRSSGWGARAELTSGVASELGAEDEHLDVVGGVSLVLGGEPIAGGRHVEGRGIPARPRRQRDHGVGNAVNQCRDCDDNRRGGRRHRGLVAGPSSSTAARSEARGRGGSDERGGGACSGAPRRHMTRPAQDPPGQRRVRRGSPVARRRGWRAALARRRQWQGRRGRGRRPLPRALDPTRQRLACARAWEAAAPP